MTAILCSTSIELSKILSTYNSLEELGFNSIFIIPDETKEIIGKTLYEHFKKPVNAILLANGSKINPKLLPNSHIIVMFDKSSDIDTKDMINPFNYLVITNNNSVLYLASQSGFHTVYTFPIFSDEMVRMLLSIPRSSYITHIDGQGFIFKGGINDKDTFPVIKQPTGSEHVTGYKHKIRLMPCTNWISTENLIKEWSRFFENTNIILVSDNPDYFLVINNTTHQIDPTKTIYFMMEPYGENLFKEWISKYSNLLFYGSHEYHLNNVEWHLSYSTQKLATTKLSNVRNNGLCTVMSSRCADNGQKYRLALIRKLDEMDLPFDFHIYGKCAELKFKNYKGEIPRIHKEEVLLKYKYNILCENNKINNYITEKLYDGILCESYTFYDGAPNVNNYFMPNSFGQLTGDLDKDVNIVIDSITNNLYDANIEHIKNMKSQLLTCWSMPVRINSIIELTDALVVIRYKTNVSQEIISSNEKKLKDQSFHYILNSIFIRDTKDEWILNICNAGLQNDKNVIVIDNDYIDNNVFQMLSNVIHLNNVELFTNITSQMQFFRLHGIEKIKMNEIAKRPFLENIVKCIFKK
jgi:hypothetical protein